MAPATRPTAATRILGALTAGYGLNELLRPQHLAKAAHLGDPRNASPAVRTLGAGLGLRDIVSGAAMALAPAGRMLDTAVAARVAFDVTDAVAFAIGSPGAKTKVKVAGVALGWAALCGTSRAWTRRS